MSVLSKVLGFFGKKDTATAEAKPAAKSAGGKGPAKAEPKVAGKAETKVTGKTAGKATGGRTEAAAPAGKADPAREAQRTRNKAARKARKRNQS